MDTKRGLIFSLSLVLKSNPKLQGNICNQFGYHYLRLYRLRKTYSIKKMSVD